MTVYRTANVWFVLTVRKWPAVLGTVSYRFSMQPYADPGSYLGFSQGRVVRGGFGAVTRAVSTFDGQYEAQTFELELSDDDGVLRGLLADDTTNRIDQNRWEGRLEFLSPQGRAAQLTPIVLQRSVVVDAVPEAGRLFRISCRDLLGGHLKGYDLDAKLPIPELGEDFGDLDEFPESNRHQMAPLVVGENSDHGTVDVNGTSAEKGLVPVFYVGKTLISDGFPGTPPTAPVYLQPPQNLAFTVHGTPGTRHVTVSVTCVTHFGETLPCTAVTCSTYPSTLDGTNYVEWTWDPPDDNADQIIAYVVYVADGNGPPKFYLEEMNNGATYVSPETTYNDDGDDAHNKGYRHGPPGRNTAQVAPGDPGVVGSGPMFWHTFICAYGVIPFTDGQVDFFGADFTGAGGDALRVKLDASTANSGIRNNAIIAPGDDLWPHTNPWITRNGRRHSGFYARGPIADAHVNGQVGMALNIGGYTDQADGTGTLIDQAAPVLQLILENFAGLDPDTPIYEDQSDWLTDPLYADGTPKLKTSAFDDFQTDGASRMGSTRGPLLRFVLTQAPTLRDLLTWFQWSTGGLLASNHHGQLFPFYVPHGASASGTRFRDRVEIREWLTPTIDRATVTEVSYIYDFDSELQDWRRKEATVQNDDAYDANGGRKITRERIEMRLVGDPLTASTAAAYWLSVFVKPRRFQPFRTGYNAIASELSDLVRLTHYDGLGATGETDTPAMLTMHEIDPDAERGTLTALDLSSFDVPNILGVTLLPAYHDQIPLPAYGDGKLLMSY